MVRWADISSRLFLSNVRWSVPVPVPVRFQRRAPPLPSAPDDSRPPPKTLHPARPPPHPGPLQLQVRLQKCALTHASEIRFGLCRVPLLLHLRPVPSGRSVALLCVRLSRLILSLVSERHKRTVENDVTRHRQGRGVVPQQKTAKRGGGGRLRSCLRWQPEAGRAPGASAEEGGWSEWTTAFRFPNATLPRCSRLALSLAPAPP